jgi:oligopeptide transport system ATP-binding protein
VSEALLEVRNLVKHFPVATGFREATLSVKAVDGVSFTLKRGETLGLVGESGCGKTTTGRCVLQLERPTSGEVVFEGIELTTLPQDKLRAMRRRMQVIFQDPYSSLNPRMTVGQILAEPMKVHGLVKDKAGRDARVRELLTQVGLLPQHARRYPHQMSGGQRQRVGIARALAMEPSLIVCDEPVSALDVSIQAQILNLLKDLQDENNLTYIFVSHNMAVIRYISDRIAVMYAGKLVELGTKMQLLDQPRHPYTELLLAAVPRATDRRRGHRTITTGEPPDLARLPSGCVFRTRCAYASERCAEEEPVLREIEPGSYVSCHFAEELTLRGVGPRVKALGE